MAVVPGFVSAVARLQGNPHASVNHNVPSQEPPRLAGACKHTDDLLGYKA